MGGHAMNGMERYEPPATLIMKRPATVVASRRVVAGRTERMAAPHHRRWALVEEVNRQERKGLVKVIRRNPVWVPERGQWEIVVRRLKDPAPPWRKPVLIGGAVLASLGGLFGLGWWVVASLSGPAVLSFLAAVLLVFLGLVITGQRGGGRHGGTEVTVTTTVNVRVR
jgi:hypothetical protein